MLDLTVIDGPVFEIEWHRVGVFARIPGVTLYPPLEREAIFKLSIYAVLLLLARDGEDADIKGDMDQCMRFVQTPVGTYLATCAGQARARSPFVWAAFSASVRLPGDGLLNAARAVVATMPKRSYLEAWLEKEGEALTQEEQDYYDRMIRSEVPPGLDSLKSFAAEMTRAREAYRKRRTRNKPRPTDVYKAVILSDWIIEALWCRRTVGIIERYPPLPQSTPEELSRSIGRIDRAISDAGFASTRLPQNENAILSAVEFLKSQLAKYTTASRTLMK